MANSYLQNTAAEVAVRLTLSGSPVTGIQYTALTVQYKQQGQSSFQPLTVTSGMWLELGGGLYTLTFPSGVMSVLGSFIYTITGAGFDAPPLGQFTIIPLSAVGGAGTFVQDQPAERSFYLSLANVPAASVLPGNVVANILKAGDPAFTVKPLDVYSWVNLGGGYYTIKFSAADMSVVGDFIYTLSSSLFDNFTFDEFVIMPLANPVTNSLCAVSGTLKNIQGVSASQIKITARPISFPAQYGGNILTADAAWCYPDNLGNWTLNLVRGSTVMLEIERAGIRAQIIIPDTPTANVLDLLPPLVNNYV